MNGEQLGLGAAFLAGLASFLSPCMLPLVPIYLTQLVGRNTAHAVSGERTHLPTIARLHLFAHACCFVLGFSLVFIALGATASALGNALRLYQVVLRLSAYSLGMGLPFLLLGLGVNQADALLRWLKPHVRTIEIGSGILLILVGSAIFFNLLALLNNYVPQFLHI